MQVKQIWANLAVEDTTRTEKFYSQLGFKPNSGKTTSEITSFIFGENNFVIHFFRKDKLANATYDITVDANKGSEIIFSLSAKTKEEVDAWAANAKVAGGKIRKEAGRHEDGYYYCVFADPDGHKFNVLLIEAGM